jgi:hypothetical protein
MKRRVGSLTIVIAVILSTVGGLATAPAAGAASGSGAERWAFCKINEERRARGLAPLAWDGTVADSARAWSRHMAATGRLAHDPGFARVLFSLVPGATHAAENVGQSHTGVVSVHSAFMGSDGHRANVLRAATNRVGVGVAHDGAGRLWITHRFVTGRALANPDTCPEGTAGAATAPTRRTPFVDVPAGSYFEGAVAWATQSGITNGTTAGTFSPNAAVTRAQTAALVWRWVGRPAGAAPRFADVAVGAYFEGATTWMRSAGLRAACAPERFCPSPAAARADVVTWMWQAAGAPDHGTGHGFADVPAGAYYERAVAWAVQTGVTTGATARTFSPADPVTRAQAVTLLWRAR